MQFYQREKFDYKKYIDTQNTEVDKTNYGLVSFVLMFIGIGTLLVWVDSSYRVGETLVASVNSVVNLNEPAQEEQISGPITKESMPEPENIIISAESPYRELNRGIYSVTYPSTLYAVRDVNGETEIITFYDRESLDVRAEGNGAIAVGLTLITMMKPDSFESLEKFAEKNALGSWEFTKELTTIKFDTGVVAELPVYSVTTNEGLFDFYFYTEEGYPYILSFMYPTDISTLKFQDDYYSVITSLQINNYNIPSDYRQRLSAIVEEYEP